MLRSWAPLAKLLVTMQPLAVADLMLENTPSLTRQTTQDEASALAVALMLLVLSGLSFGAVIARYVLHLIDRPPAWMPVVLLLTACPMGGVTVMVASGPHTNLVLSLLYFAETVALLMASHLTEREIEASHVR